MITNNKYRLKILAGKTIPLFHRHVALSFDFPQLYFHRHFCVSIRQLLQRFNVYGAQKMTDRVVADSWEVGQKKRHRELTAEAAKMALKIAHSTS